MHIGGLIRRVLLDRPPFPSNKHDPNAVAVYVDGQKIGYVPREQAEIIAAVMDAGEWTYACPYMRVGWWDEKQIYTVSMSIERRRPGPNIIGSEHLVKSASRKAIRAEELIQNREPLWPKIVSGMSTARGTLRKTSGMVGTSLQRVDTRIVELCGGDPILRWMILAVVAVVACTLIFFVLI